MTSDNHATGLKPCPFCGSTDLIVGEDDSLHSIICRGCCCEMPYMSLDDPQSERWNTRSQPSTSEQASVHSPDEVELVTDAIVAAIKADCTEPNGNCYAVGNRDAMEVDGEFDPEAIARAAIVTMKSKWKRGEASVHSPDEVERVAQALCRHDANKGGIWFDDEALNKHIFNNWRKFQPEARAALSAMNRNGMRKALTPLVIAARKIAFGGLFDGCDDDQRAAIKALDDASEAFAATVPWGDE